MPLLLRRRSALDLLNTNADHEDLPRPDTTNSALAPAAPASPRPVSESGFPTSRLSHQLLREEVDDERLAPAGDRSKRFSLMKFRNFSESHLTARVKEEGRHEHAPPVPARPDGGVVVPSIMTTAPAFDDGKPQVEEEEEEEEEERERKSKPSLFKRSASKSRHPARQEKPRKSMDEKRNEKSKAASSLRWRRLQGRSTGLEDLAHLSTVHVQQNHAAAAASAASAASAPPSYGDESNSSLALPVPAPRYSESSQTDGSGDSGDPIYGTTTTTTHVVSTHTTFFELPRRKKKRHSLFPLLVKQPPPDAEPSPSHSNGPATPRASTSAFSTTSLQPPGDERSPPRTILQRRHTEASPTKQRATQGHPPLSTAHAGLAQSSRSLVQPGMNLSRNDSQRSRNSDASSPLQPPMRLGVRDCASTTSSRDRASHDMDTPPPLTGSGRNSTSTNGRPSFGGFLSLARFRQGSGPDSPRHGSPGTRSQSNSFAISREALVVPEREEGDTPGKYLERLEAAVARSMIAGILSKSADPFAQAVLRSYTRRFPFFGEPIDMSLRKFLLEAELPKETQQVDRVIQAFADRYNECNPGIFVSPDQAYIIAFSLMMLHTDAFNKNNKRKMQKHDYIKNTSGQHVADDILACFYDNICYTPFVHYEEEVDINGERVLPFQAKKKSSKLKAAIAGDAAASKKALSGPVDPYNLLVDQKLDLLRPAIKESMIVDDPYNYRGSQGSLDTNYLQRAFTHTGVLQIISARSRPTAYEGQLNHNNPSPVETSAGIIDLKITKVGTLWRKATKRKKARSPWQEWGAILTGSQLYLFKNAHWAKGLLHQFTQVQRLGQPRVPVIFKPPLQEFKPDALIKTDHAVALTDATYTRHKHAFTFVRPGGQEEVLLADNEAELNDWLALINYAAAFRAAGVRIRGMLGGNEEDLRKRDVTRLGSSNSTRSGQTAVGEPVTRKGGWSPQLQRQVMAARRQIMVQKISEFEKEIAEANQQFDGMLRHARHLLVLAPIAPKTREDIIHAAAKFDAMIKWLRRDMWRMKCHRDILAMDVQQDGVSATELEAWTTAEQQQKEAALSSAKKDKERPLIALARLASKATAARSPPQSPTSPSSRSGRPSTTGSLETFMGNDVFRTPPESAVRYHREGENWGLPPLQLDVQPSQQQHRTSVTSTLLTASSPGKTSLSHASSTSSVRPVGERKTSAAGGGSSSGSGVERVTSTSSKQEKAVEVLARSTIASESVAPGAAAATHGISSLDGSLREAPTATPESKAGKGVRRSLQKTLRDGNHHSSQNRHRRGKDSDGAIRASGVSAEGDEPQQEGTPGLARETGRFILHGKQASVIHFGNDWPNERMKLRREVWRQHSGSPKEEKERDDWQQSFVTAWGDGRRESVGARPALNELDHAPVADEGTASEEDDEDDGTPSVSTSAHSHSFREDAEAAAAFATTATSPPAIISSAPSPEGGEGGAAATSFDLSSWDSKAAKRQTVIGPRHASGTNTDEGVQQTTTRNGGPLVADEDPSVSGPRENRRTIIGPSPSTGKVRESTAASAGKDLHGEKDDPMIQAPTDDEEAMRMSPHAVRVL